MADYVQMWKDLGMDIETDYADDAEQLRARRDVYC